MNKLCAEVEEEDSTSLSFLKRKRNLKKKSDKGKGGTDRKDSNGTRSGLRDCAEGK